MGKPYSMDLRERVVGSVMGGRVVLSSGGCSVWCRAEHGSRVNTSANHGLGGPNAPLGVEAAYLSFDCQYGPYYSSEGNQRGTTETL